MIGHLISSYRAMVKLGGAGSPSSWFDVQAHQIVRISDNGMPELRIIQAAGMKCFEEIVIIQVSQAGVSAISNCRNQTSPMVSAIRK